VTEARSTVRSQSSRVLVGLLVLALLGIVLWTTQSSDSPPVRETVRARGARRMGPLANGPILYVRTFVIDRDPPFGHFTSSVYRMTATGEGNHMLLDGGSGTFFYAFAPFPDGESALLTRGQFRVGTDGVFELNPAEGSFHKAFSCPGIGCFGTMVPSPDGREIAVVKGMNVYVMNRDGSDLTQLTHCDPPGTRRHPPDSCYGIDGVAWSPDGSRLVFAQQTFRGVGRLFVMGRDGSDLHQITECESRSCLGGARDAFPSWSPDGSQILFERGFNIYAVSPGGTHLRRVTSCPLVGLAAKRTCEATFPIWSPDGSLIAFQGMDGIYLINPDGSSQQRIGPSEAELRAWMPAPQA
jgi:hypothetical protein